MDNSIIKTSVSLPTSLWNDIQKAMNQDGIPTFSRWVQNSSRFSLKTREARNMFRYISSLSDTEINTLKKILSL